MTVLYEPLLHDGLVAKWQPSCTEYDIEPRYDTRKLTLWLPTHDAYYLSHATCLSGPEGRAAIESESTYQPDWQVTNVWWTKFATIGHSLRGRNILSRSCKVMSLASN